MKKSTLTFLLLMAALLAGFSSCLSNQAPDSAHNSRNSLDWEGIYTGIIPAASSPGINVQISLNYDETFVLRYEYLDRPNNISSLTGPFKWDRAGSIITLDVKDLPPYYKVGENLLIQLDMQGNVITGNLADSYVLRKQP
jgi:uncharacterized lipoprotein NlpE involved in copper resistance